MSKKLSKKERAKALADAHVPVVHVQPAATVAPTPPVAAMSELSIQEAKVRHQPQQVIEHQPIIEKEIFKENAIQVQHEHHIQPIIHEVEHRVQPIIKTQATTESPVIVQDYNVMEAPIIERANLPVGLGPVERVTPEGILHVPRVEHQTVNERPLEVKHEHHIQPIIHEREHHIQPIVKTQVTAEEVHLKADRNVMLQPVMDKGQVPAGLEPVERLAPEGVVHRPKLEKEVLVEHPVEVKHEHHIQPIIHEREHHIQPIVKTEVTLEQCWIEQEHTVMLPPIVEPPMAMGAKSPQRPTGGAVATTVVAPGKGGVSITTTAQPLPPVGAPAIGGGLAAETGMAAPVVVPLAADSTLGTTVVSVAAAKKEAKPQVPGPALEARPTRCPQPQHWA